MQVWSSWFSQPVKDIYNKLLIVSNVDIWIEYKLVVSEEDNSPFAIFTICYNTFLLEVEESSRRFSYCKVTITAWVNFLDALQKGMVLLTYFNCTSDPEFRAVLEFYAKKL